MSSHQAEALQTWVGAAAKGPRADTEPGRGNTEVYIIPGKPVAYNLGYFQYIVGYFGV